jgi:putative flippase GtrA
MISLPMSLFKFALVGVSNTLIGLGVIYFSWSVIGVNDLAANLTGYLVGFLWSFFANRHWTFFSQAKVAKSMWRYAQVCGAAYIANLGTLFFTRNLIGHDSFLPHIAGAIVYTGLAYIGSRRFVFIDS